MTPATKAICASVVAILLFLCHSTAQQVRTDYHLKQARSTVEWKESERHIMEGVKAMPNSSYYLDKAGGIYLSLYRDSGDKRAYDNASKLFQRAHINNPYDSYVLLHIIQLDLAALQKGVLKKPSRNALKAASAALRLDRNNKVVQDVVRELRRRDNVFRRFNRQTES